MFLAAPALLTLPPRLGASLTPSQQRYETLLAALAEQDAIIAAAYKKIEGYSAELERTVAKTVDGINAEKERAAKVARKAQAAIQAALEGE